MLKIVCSQLSFKFSLGSLLFIILVIQIFSGLVLAIFYVNDANISFISLDLLSAASSLAR